jgi:hypothetical protein
VETAPPLAPPPRSRPQETVGVAAPAIMPSAVEAVEADNGEDSSYATADPADVRPAPSGRPTVMRLPATAEQRERIMRDPLVLRALDLFEGTIVNMEREVSAGPPEAEEESE